MMFSVAEIPLREQGPRPGGRDTSPDRWAQGDHGPEHRYCLPGMLSALLCFGLWLLPSLPTQNRGWDLELSRIQSQSAACGMPGCSLRPWVSQEEAAARSSWLGFGCWEQLVALGISPSELDFFVSFLQTLWHKEERSWSCWLIKQRILWIRWAWGSPGRGEVVLLHQGGGDSSWRHLKDTEESRPAGNPFPSKLFPSLGKLQLPPAPCATASPGWHIPVLIPCAQGSLSAVIGEIKSQFTLPWLKAAGCK